MGVGSWDMHACSAACGSSLRTLSGPAAALRCARSGRAGRAERGGAGAHMCRMMGAQKPAEDTRMRVSFSPEGTTSAEYGQNTLREGGGHGRGARQGAVLSGV